MAFKIQLVDETQYDVERCDIVNGTLEIEFLNKTSEETQTICSNSANFNHIDFIAEDGGVFGMVDNWTVYGGVLLKGESVVAYMSQPVDDTQSRLTQAEANALEAKTTASNANTVASNAVSTANKASTDAEEAKSIAENAKNTAEGVEFAGDQIDAVFTVAKANAQSLDDETALKVKILYESWETLCASGFLAKDAGYKFIHTVDGQLKLFKTAQQEFTFQSQWEPGSVGTESIYTVIDETHAGTLEDPIPYEKNMELFNGKYYTQNDVLYQCIRDSGIAMQYDLADLISGGFVKVVEQ